MSDDIPELILPDDYRESSPNSAKEPEPRPESPQQDAPEMPLGLAEGLLQKKALLPSTKTSLRNKSKFIPPDALSETLNRSEVFKKLNSLARDSMPLQFGVSKYVDDICGGAETGPEFLKIFAIMSWVECESEIFSWIDKGHPRDSDLPLVKEGKEWYSSKNRRRGKPLACFKGWRFRDLELFDSFQYKVAVPTFSREPGKKVPHRDFSSLEILPFLDPGEEQPRPPPGTGDGGYGKVICVRLPRSCYDFDKLFKTRKVRHQNSIACLAITPRKGEFDHL
jgi:hypothetical protein